MPTVIEARVELEPVAADPFVAAHRRGLTRVEYAERRLDDVNRAIEDVLDGTASAPRLVFRMTPVEDASRNGHGQAAVAAVGG